jgi:hypothetical protein
MRQALLDLLWTKSLRALAPEIGVSDATLRKVATRTDLPIPSLGHWMRLAVGKKSVAKLALPPRAASARPTTSSSASRSGRIRRRNDRLPRRRRGCSTSVHPTTPKGGLWPRS